MENGSPGRTKFIKMVRRFAPPVLTIAASALILSGAAWLHQREQGAKSLKRMTSGNLSGTQVNQANQETNLVMTLSAPNKAGQGKPVSNSTSKSSQAHADSAGTNTPATGQSGQVDIGFSPVSGGTISTQTSLIPSTTSSCTVLQYGQTPNTTWGQGSVTNSGGSTLTPPLKVSSNRLLELPVQNGILWAPVPATNVGASGQIGEMTTPTPLFYTPYPSQGTSHALSANAELLGEIPISESTVTQFTDIAWYHPSTDATIGAKALTNYISTQSSSNNTAGADMSQTNQNGDGLPGNGLNSTNNTNGGNQQTASSTSNSAGANSTGTNTTSSSPSPMNQTALYISGLYQTADGAVITMTAHTKSSDVSHMWVYLWNEKTLSLLPVADLPNGAGQFSWLAVGQDLVYWGIRHVLPPTYDHYSGAQYVLNIHSDKKTRIHLGTWVREAVASGDNLQVMFGDSIHWKLFTPSVDILTFTSSS